MLQGHAHPWLLRSCTALLLVPVLACTHVEQPDPLIGTWALNVGRSKFHPNLPPESMTVTCEQTPKGMHTVSIVILRDGSRSRNEYTAAYDGKDYPIIGVPQVDTVSLRKIDTLTSERIDKRDGRRVQSEMRQVYSDGHTLVVTQKGTDATGVNHLMVFDRK